MLRAVNEFVSPILGAGEVERVITYMDNLLAKVQEALKAAFDVDPQSVTIDTTPNDIPAWDSMGHIALVSSLERAFGLSFDVDEVMEMENVRQILRIVQSKLPKP
jgi:acyl carrier protein